MGIFIALASAISWGSGDFCGGIASRRINQFQVLFLASLSSLFLLLLLAWLRGENIPGWENTLISLTAGVSGAVGLSALYRGLSIGDAAVVAPVAGVVGVIVPILVGIFQEGFPGYPQVAGFTLALYGIWLVSSKNGEGNTESKNSLILAVFAGIGFGGFLTLIAQIDGNQVFSPLVVAKFASFMFAVVLLRRKEYPFPPIKGHPIAILTGLLDAGGNLLYLVATQYSRLDVVAVLTSLYPGFTVLLSSVILKEDVSSRQWAGAIICISAIVLITI
jgi:drug/metabolite transporter (DMT)-like permease